VSSTSDPASTASTMSPSFALAPAIVYDLAIHLDVHLDVLCSKFGPACPTGLGSLDVARRAAERIDRLLGRSGRNLEREAEEPEPQLLFDEPDSLSTQPQRFQGFMMRGPTGGGCARSG
jgi:hypothetical protein